MQVASWNICGAAFTKLKKKDVTKFIDGYDILILCEAALKSLPKALRRIFNFKSSYRKKGRGGGISILWKKKWDHLISISQPCSNTLCCQTKFMVQDKESNDRKRLQLLGLYFTPEGSPSRISQTEREQVTETMPNIIAKIEDDNDD